MASVFLLTGSPGVGKTTIIREALAAISVKAGGFYTQEIRESGIRQGFKIITLEGRESILSHVNYSSHYRVGKYSVNVENLDNIGVFAIYQGINNSDLIVIDEIGKMELFSPSFKESVLKAIDSGKQVLGTIMLSPNPFADEIKKHPDVKLFTVTQSNRSQVLQELIRSLS